MLKPVFGLDRQGLRRAAAAGVVGATLPNDSIKGPLAWPGQHAGFLGAKRDPWHINGDSDATRDGYGRNKFGQLPLLPRLDSSWSPAEIRSTIFKAFGIEWGATLIDPFHCPHHLLSGNVISNSYTGATA